MEQLTLSQLESVLDACRQALCAEIDADELDVRNEVAHKWMVTYRTIVLRELVAWRFVDLLQQAIILERSQKFIGSRIIIRSAIETLAMLLYSIRKMESIVRTGEGFHQYSAKTENLLLGSRDTSTPYENVSVTDILKALYQEHPILKGWYDELSETTHPNFDGLMRVYSETSWDGKRTKFTDDTGRIYKDTQLPIVQFLCSIFDDQYNSKWHEAFVNFEKWIEDNNQKLKDTKPAESNIK